MQQKQNYLNKLANDTAFNLAAIFLVAFALTIPIYILGVPASYDLPNHLQFAGAYFDALSKGDFFPGWSSEDNHGFGSIGIRFYPPVNYYLLALTKMAVGNWFDATVLNVFWWTFVGCVGVYFWAKEWLSPAQATLAAGLYALVPYRVEQIYTYFLYAEFAAAAVSPFCFLFITRICRRGNAIDFLLFSVSYSILILTHIPSTVILSICIAVYTLLLLDWRKYLQILPKLLAFLFFSLSATAFHWVKIVTEVNWLNHNSEQFITGSYDYKRFFFPMFLIDDIDDYQMRMLWFIDIAIVITFVLFLPAIIVLIIKLKKKLQGDNDRRVIIALFGTGLFSFFMMSYPSVYVWQSFGFLQKIQFPWRWMSAASLIVVLSFSCAVPQLLGYGKKSRKLGIYLIVFFMLSLATINVTQLIIPSAPIPRSDFEQIVAERQRVGCPCWWTIWGQQKAFDRKDKVFADNRAVEISSWESESREFTVEAGTPIDIRAATFYYPHWKATINGEAAEITKDADGAMLIPVGSEKSQIKLYFQEPSKINLALWLSMLTWIILLGALIIFYRRNNKLGDLD